MMKLVAQETRSSMAKLPSSLEDLPEITEEREAEGAAASPTPSTGCHA